MYMSLADIAREQALPLDYKIQTAVYAIAHGFNASRHRPALAFSGGKDSTVLWHIIGEWVYGGLFETEDGCWIVRLAPGEYEAWIIEHIRVDPDTVGQCTGLVDKNGTAIFAGDVLRYHDDEDGFDGPGRLIVWDDGRAAFCTHEIGRGPTCEIIPHRKEQYSSAYFDDCCLSVCDIREDYAVAGNLYDNPELMGVVS